MAGPIVVRKISLKTQCKNCGNDGTADPIQLVWLYQQAGLMGALPDGWHTLDELDFCTAHCLQAYYQSAANRQAAAEVTE